MVQPPVFRKVPFIFHGFIMFFPDSGSIAIESRKAKAKLLLENNPGKIPIMMVKSKSSSVTLSKESCKTI